MSHKVLLFSVESINNAGDEILRKATSFLISNNFPNCEIEYAQFIPNEKSFCGTGLVRYYAGALIRRYSRNWKNYIGVKITQLSYVISNSNYYSKRIKKTDKVILCAGMLKYSTQDHSHIFYLINNIAFKYGKDVMLSAMSVERASTCDWRFKLLVRGINMPCVKFITTRDGCKGLDILNTHYVSKHNLFIDYVGDVALWIPECYGIKKVGKKSCKPVVGINIIRKGIFDDYNKSLQGEELLSIYIRLVKLLDSLEWEWKFFCNGMLSDWRVIQELQLKIGFKDSHILPRPCNSEAFVKMVSQFDVVFGSRLHACITSVALGIPVVGFVWDDKLKYFSETMKISQFFFQPSEMTAEKIVMKMKEALDYDFDFENIERYKQKTKESIIKFLQS